MDPWCPFILEHSSMLIVCLFTQCWKVLVVTHIFEKGDDPKYVYVDTGTNILKSKSQIPKSCMYNIRLVHNIWLDHKVQAAFATNQDPICWVNQLNSQNAAVMLYTNIPWMEEILHHHGCLKPCKQWDYKLPTNWCRIYSINSSIAYPKLVGLKRRYVQALCNPTLHQVLQHA